MTSVLAVPDGRPALGVRVAVDVAAVAALATEDEGRDWRQLKEVEARIDTLPPGASFDAQLHGHRSRLLGDEPLVTLFVRG